MMIECKQTQSSSWLLSATMDSNPVFPQELFDAVIDHLADDSVTLRECALVSTSFYARARTFYRLQFGRLDNNRTPTELYNLLEGSPSFAARVKSLLIRERLSGTDVVQWHRLIESFPTDLCLALLANLTQLCIDLTTDALPFRWEHVPEALQDSIHFMVALPTFTCLELHNISGVPFILLCHCPSLRSLTLKWVTFAGEWSGAVAACIGSLPARLEHLSLELGPALQDLIFRWILLPESPLDVSCIRVLECRVHHFGPDSTIQLILNASAATLQHLRLNNCQALGYRLKDVLDLQELPQLHTLSIDIWRDAFVERDMRIFSLGHLNFSAQQQPLALNFHLHTEYAYSGAEWFSDADRALSALPFITSVTVILWPWVQDSPEGQREDLIDVSAELVQKMPLMVNTLVGRGALRLLRSSRFRKSKMFPPTEETSYETDYDLGSD
ncbi:hypothetical protein MSAN_01231200 [Mycena sanguinolenta]|uniref:F-box domain-containing protein n=1 Tax=Mycena sanguinolenta TaxID=230812 RepID=A0A8H6YD66_9AGAR|nr:hypothetical protein MSAN_01231200 [Mycena sanguinolenta]